MGQITLTAKVQIYPDDEQKELLIRTRKAYTDGLNFVSDIVYNSHNLCENDLSRELYPTLRERFGLKSQQSQSVIKRVLASYKTIQSQEQGWIRPSFKKDQYELVWDRDAAFYKGRLISVNTVRKRIKVPYSIKGYERYFNDPRYKLGTARLLIRHGKYYLHVPLSYNVEELDPAGAQTVVGIDRGLRFIMVTYDSNGGCSFVNGRKVMQKRRQYVRIRKRLQKKHTASARRRLKAIGSREGRWVADINHCISKRLVESYPAGTLFVFEDLSGIKEVTAKVKKKNRYTMCSWSYFDLEQKLIYKARLKGSIVIKVDPHYTSQRCPICGYTDKGNRNKKNHIFICKNCGYRSNDDRIGGMNLCRMGIEWLSAQVPGTVAAGV